MALTAHMRTYGSAVTPLTVVQAKQPVIVEIPGFGYLAVGQRPDGEWQARFDNLGRRSDRAVTVHDATAGRTVEVELLPNPSTEERLVVVIEGFPDGKAGDVPEPTPKY